MSSPRYRCAACGNLTRFDVMTDRRTRAFHHYSVGGSLSVEEEEVISEDVVEVQCRWCGHGRSIEELPHAAPGDHDPALASTSAEGEPTQT